MKFNVSSSTRVGGNSISFSFQMKQKRNMVIAANENSPGNKEYKDIYSPYRSQKLGLGQFSLSGIYKDLYSFLFPPITLHRWRWPSNKWAERTVRTIYGADIHCDSNSLVYADFTAPSSYFPCTPSWTLLPFPFSANPCPHFVPWLVSITLCVHASLLSSGAPYLSGLGRNSFLICLSTWKGSQDILMHCYCTDHVLHTTSRKRIRSNGTLRRYWRVQTNSN